MVQGYVLQLRKALATSGNGAEIVTRGRAYELRLGDGELDVRHFERLLADGAPREALSLWRGPPLDDVATEPFAPLEIRRLEGLRVQAVEMAIEQDLAAGRHAEAVPELQRLIAQEPLRERLHGLRMLALYRSGRQADALGAYRRARDELVNAIGVDPGPELRRLHEAILRQDPALDLPVLVQPPLELDTTIRLAGRDEELAVLRERWRRARTGDGAELLVTGPPGIGKTRLAAELADGVRRDGGHVLYAAGAASPALARRVIEGGPRDPATGAAGGRRRRPRARGGHRRAQARGARGPPAAVVTTAEKAAGATLALGPLAAPAIEAIAREYGEAPPLDRLVEESAGVPGRVHRAVRRAGLRPGLLSSPITGGPHPCARAGGQLPDSGRADSQVIDEGGRLDEGSLRARGPAAQELAHHQRSCRPCGCRT